MRIALEGNDLPVHLTKNAPRLGGIPAVYLSMIAVAHRYQGQGIGRILLADALNRAADAADQIGLKAVVLDVIEDVVLRSQKDAVRSMRLWGFSRCHRVR